MDGLAPVYQQVGTRNIYRGREAVRIIATYINWKNVGEEPAVIAENSARIKSRIRLHDGALDNEPCAIVGSAPSLADTWEQIRACKTIFTCAGAHRYLIERGIVPMYHVDSDPRAYKADILGDPHPAVTYLIASICHPTYFDKLELFGTKVKLWHMLFLEPEIFRLFPVNDWILTGGHTVGPRAIKIARLMGYANFHIFGIDASARQEKTGIKTHAEGHPNPPSDLESIDYDGQRYLSNGNWQDHAGILLKDFDRMPEVQYKFYGNGLMQHMAQNHVRVKRAKMPIRVYRGEDGNCYW